ncbi:MAG: hypothetical protein H7Y12_08755 [Sphingobacteriaceae bacterium]|nr:hypothetical protein [Cytophagaceae bacterium]
MFRTLSHFLYRIASWKTLLVALVLSLALVYTFEIFGKNGDYDAWQNLQSKSSPPSLTPPLP